MAKKKWKKLKSGEEKEIDVGRPLEYDYKISEKKWENYYNAYTLAYDKKALSLAKQGREMIEEMLSYEDYKMERTKIRNEGHTQNINRYIVEEQTNYLRIGDAKRILEIGKQYNFDYVHKRDRDGNVIERTAKEIQRMSPERLGFMEAVGDMESEDRFDLLKMIDDMLKKAHPTWTTRQRGKWISYEVFGS